MTSRKASVPYNGLTNHEKVTTKPATGGPSRKKVKNSPVFQLTRQNATELGGCAKATASIRHALYPVKQLGDIGFTGRLNALGKRIQLLDTLNKRGERAVRCSQYGHLLEGFHLNEQHFWDAVIRHPLRYNIDRATGTARVEVPELIPGINLMIPWNAPVFRLIFTLGVVTDSIYNGTDYKNTTALQPVPTVAVYTEWAIAQSTFPARQYQLELTAPELLTTVHTLLLCAGIEMGTPVSNTYAQPIKYAGCARILMVG
jgi:hypothetical protein